MANERQKSFVLYKDSFPMFAALQDDQAGKLIKAIFRYEIDGVEPNFGNDQMTNMVFMMVKQYLDRNNEKYKETCKKNSANQSIRWIKNRIIQKMDAKEDITADVRELEEICKKNRIDIDGNLYARIRSYTNYTDNDNDSDNDTDNDNETDNDNDNETDNDASASVRGVDIVGDGGRLEVDSQLRSDFENFEKRVRDFYPENKCKNMSSLLSSYNDIYRQTHGAEYVAEAVRQMYLSWCGSHPDESQKYDWQYLPGIKSLLTNDDKKAEIIRIANEHYKKNSKEPIWQ